MQRIRMLAWKEALQLIRDRATLGMLLGVPLLQILLFGCAVELTPKQIVVQVVSTQAQTLARVDKLLHEAAVFADVRLGSSLAVAREAQRHGETLLVVDADARPPHVYLDATDPILAAHARAAIESFGRSLADPFAGLPEATPAMRIEELYNPGARTQPFILSGLLGLILTMTLVTMSALCLARERERGTLECLLALKVTPVELAVGKLAPYVALAMIQASLVLALAHFGFHMPVRGSLGIVASITLLFALANLGLGFLFSSLARQQMQAMQLSFFYFLPSALLSGFMFPFAAMPRWAQTVGEMLPLTHYLRVVRGIALRGAEGAWSLPEFLPILAFAAIVLGASFVACRATLR
jgi:ABC-2 type transport system permease protein